jgi:nucleoside-diphosphate-sugar epimerase
MTNRLRTEATDHLLAAGRAVGARRFVAQSFGALCGLRYVVDDEPAPVREWLPVLANALDAKPPRRVPRWLGRLVAGEAATMMLTEARGASNEKAKHELGWQLRYPSWRQGFAQGLA